MLKIIVFGSQLFLLIILYTGCANISGHPLSKDTVKDLFGKDIDCTLISSQDFIGPDIHGERFLFYEYKLSSSQLQQLEEQNTFKGYPSFNSGYFSKVKLPDSNLIAKWKHFPIRSHTDSLIFQSTFQLSQVERVMGETHYLSSDNYYSCINAKAVGNVFFILSPGANRLYMVVRYAG